MPDSLDSLSFIQIALGSGLILLSVLLMRWLKIPLIKDLACAAIRTVGQLLAIGYVLTLIFHQQQGFLIVGYLAVMALIAGMTVVGRLHPRRKKDAFWAIQISLWLGTGVTLAWISQIVLKIHPWYNPQFLIPLAGMLLGNSVNSASIALERFHSELTIRRPEIETLLSLGATPKQAAQSSFKASMIAGMIPNINAMMIVGVVSLPGMMTGQILAGQLPFKAVGYQIIVMFMITGAASMTLTVLLLIARYRAFNRFGQLQAASDFEN